MKASLASRRPSYLSLTEEVTEKMSKDPQRSRVVITGIGAITPLGLDVESVWASCLSAQSGIRAIQAFDSTSFPCRIAGEAWNFEPTAWMSAKEASHAELTRVLIMARSQRAG